MFELLATSMQKALRALRGRGRLSESNIRESMREVRMALLEADVNYRVAGDFIARVTRRCLGKEVLESVTPGQMVVKQVYDEMVELLGGQFREPDLAGHPAVVVLLGLHGSGKTTTAGKLSALWSKEGHNVMLAAADIRRPAAVDQLRILADRVKVPMIAPEPGESVPEFGKRALEHSRREGRTPLIVDTGGRFHLDAEMLEELQSLCNAVEAREKFLVVDSAIGQESVNVAESFNKLLGLTGLILTKMDGDARGGAALSIRAVSGCPVMFSGIGEKYSDLERFHPDRMASRILGMGDVVSLVEKAQSTIDQRQTAEMERKLRDNTFDLSDFLKQLQQVKRLGPMDNILKMLPSELTSAAGKLDENADQAAEMIKKNEAIILSMTLRERRYPNLLNASRRRRIARGSGTRVENVNFMLRQFDQMRKMARRFGKMQKRLRMPI